MKPEVMRSIFEKACSYIRCDYIDREFILEKWASIEAAYSARVTELSERKDFEAMMSQMVSDELDLSHCQFITPQLRQEIEAQSIPETAPSIFQTVFKTTHEYSYLKISTFQIPLFQRAPIYQNLKSIHDCQRPLILDFRLNSGGSISATGDLLAPFIGADTIYCYSKLANWEEFPDPQVAYPLQEEENEGSRLDVEMTLKHPHLQWRTPKEIEFSLKQEVLLLIDKRNYSCGEVFSQTMKEMGRCKLIGNVTSGSVVGAKDDYDCGHGYELLLPYLNLVSPEQFRIEGQGVHPHTKKTFQTPDTNPLPHEEILEILKQEIS
jgi:C-terminal processing protease CtpA/Prc